MPDMKWIDMAHGSSAAPCSFTSSKRNEGVLAHIEAVWRDIFKMLQALLIPSSSSPPFISLHTAIQEKLSIFAELTKENFLAREHKTIKL